MVLYIVICHKRMGISLWNSVCFSGILKKFQGKIVMKIYYKQYISLQLNVFMGCEAFGLELSPNVLI